MIGTAEAVVSAASSARDRHLTKLGLLSLNPLQQSDALKVLNGSNFGILDCTKCMNAKDAFERIVNENGGYRPLVVLMTVKHRDVPGAESVSRDISIVVEQRDNLKRFEEKYDVALGESKRVLGIEEGLKSDGRIAALYAAIPEELRVKYKISGAEVNGQASQIILLHDAHMLVQGLGISKSTGTGPIQKWSKLTSIEKNKKVPEFADVYWGAKLDTLVNLANEISLSIIASQNEAAALARGKLFKALTGPTARWIVGAAVASGLTAKWGLEYGSDPTRPANEEKLAQFVKRVGVKNLNISDAPINVKLDRYGNGQIAEVRILSAEEGTYKGGHSSTYQMGLTTVLSEQQVLDRPKNGPTFFTVKLTEKPQDSGPLVIENASGINSSNIHLCSEAAHKAIEWITIGSATPDYKTTK